ncbi:G-patch domain and KOW motifs-containing protein-like [Patiria miniata]|uniref:Uncharacterized protein n=1 Tax=Patiria miniata TaxID=46514 RepID=A0A913Z2F9_PATMI|nr:G-patch domain and KOW motifs-containing protein-like [Patiria miniata]
MSGSGAQQQGGNVGNTGTISGPNSPVFVGQSGSINLTFGAPPERAANEETQGQHCSDREERQMNSDKKRRKIQDKYDSDSGSYNTTSANAQSREQSYWLRPDLRVRFIDRQYKNGRYFNSKVCIEDVKAQGICTCRTEDGRILEDIDQSMLETLIPKGDMACVMIVAGKLRGQLGSVVKRDKSKANADVQLRDRDQIKTLDYDDICEYAGN